MVNSNSIIEFYRKSIVSGIVTDCVYNSTNDVGEKVKVRVWPTWKTKTHLELLKKDLLDLLWLLFLFV